MGHFRRLSNTPILPIDQDWLKELSCHSLIIINPPEYVSKLGLGLVVISFPTFLSERSFEKSGAVRILINFICFFRCNPFGKAEFGPLSRGPQRLNHGPWRVPLAGVKLVYFSGAAPNVLDVFEYQPDPSGTNKKVSSILRL